MDQTIENITIHRVFKIWRWYIKIPLWIHDPLKVKLKDIDWFTSDWSDTGSWSVCCDDLKPGNRYVVNLNVKPGEPYKLERIDENETRNCPER